MMTRIVTLVLALGVVFGPASVAAAHDAHVVVVQNDDDTPGADDDAEAGQDAGDEDSETSAEPTVGDPVTFAGDTGDALASITVERVTVGFDDFGEFFTVEENATYVAVEVTIENLDPDDDAFDFSTYYVGLQTEDGFYYTQTYVYFDEADASDYPDLASEPIPAGDTASGFLFYAVPDDKTPARLFYGPSGRLLLLADLRDAD